jgi:hypothetical protein
MSAPHSAVTAASLPAAAERGGDAVPSQVVVADEQIGLSQKAQERQAEMPLPQNLQSLLLMGIFVLLLFFALYFTGAVVLPIIFAIILYLVLQIGGQVAELVLTIMSNKALSAVIDNQFKVGGNIDVAVGPVGKGLSASTTSNLRGDAYSFAKTQGLYGGVSLEGAGILERGTWNTEYYGAGATPDGIVNQRRHSNKDAEMLRTALASY